MLFKQRGSFYLYRHTYGAADLTTAVSINRSIVKPNHCKILLNIIHRGKSCSNTNIEHRASKCKTSARFTTPVTRGIRHWFQSLYRSGNVLGVTKLDSWNSGVHCCRPSGCDSQSWWQKLDCSTVRGGNNDMKERIVSDNLNLVSFASLNA